MKATNTIATTKKALSQSEVVEKTETYWKRFRDAKATNPRFAEFVNCWNQRDDMKAKVTILEEMIKIKSDRMKELRSQLSKEEQDLL